MLSREEHQQSLISNMLSIMSLILNEEEAPQPLLEVVLQNLRKNGEVKLSAQYMHCCYIAALSAKQTFFSRWHRLKLLMDLSIKVIQCTPCYLSKSEKVPLLVEFNAPSGLLTIIFMKV